MGKGSAERPGDRDAYRRGYDRIFGTAEPEPFQPAQLPTPYEYSPEEVLATLTVEESLVVIQAARCLHPDYPGSLCPDDIVGEWFEGAAPGEELTRRQAFLLGRVGSYAKAMGWYSPKPQKKTS